MPVVNVTSELITCVVHVGLCIRSCALGITFYVVIGNSVAILSGSTGLDCGTITRAYVSKTSFTFIAPRDSSQTR